jgi:hypothetical protein
MTAKRTYLKDSSGSISFSNKSNLKKPINLNAENIFMNFQLTTMFNNLRHENGKWKYEKIVSTYLLAAN